MEGDDHGEAYTAIEWGRTLSRERHKIAEAETVDSVEGNMCGAVMRGADALPWSKTPSRSKGSRRNLGDLTPPIPALAVLGHDGKSMRRSRRGRDEESDGCIIPVMRRTKLVRASGGDGGGKAAGRREGEQQRMLRTLRRAQHVTQAASPRIGDFQTHDRV